ncbi:MAG: hypothetical protein RI911_547 [Candidatus Parcubacteria bacterium]|jgi:hypothetical protein
MSFHSHINHFEQFIVRNKWIVCVLLSVAMIVAVPLYLYTENTGRMGMCMNRVQDAFNQEYYPGEESEDIELDSSMRYSAAKRTYYECVAQSGIDVRSVPHFDDIYTDQNESDFFFDDSGYETLDESMYE